MKIDSSSKVVGGQSNTSPGATVRPAAVGPAVTDPVSSQVEISRTATKLKQVGEAYDAERVAEIRQAISEGKFQINPERIADGLLDSVRTMLSRQQQEARP